METGKQNTSKFKFQILATHARWNQFSILCKKRNIFFVWEHQQNTFVTLSGFWLLKGMGVRGGRGVLRSQSKIDRGFVTFLTLSI